MARGADLSATAQRQLGLPPGFKTYSPFPFAGLNLQDAAIAVDNAELTYCENFLRLGKGYMRAAPDLGEALYTAPEGLSIISFYFYTIASTYYVAIFLSDGSAVQVQVDNGAQTTIGPSGTFYQSASALVPACTQWGVQYLLISNNNTTNDFWAWDGALLYQGGSAAPNGVVLGSVGAGYITTPSVTAFGGGGSGLVLSPTVLNGGIVNVKIVNPGQGYKIGDIVQLAFSGGNSDASAILSANLTPTSVAAVEVVEQGRGYTQTPGVSFAGGGGTGAAATAIITNGQLTAINITSPGAGYTGAPSVTIGGPGTGALAQAILNPTTVANVTVVNPGSDFTSAPNISFVGGGGAGATGIVTLQPTEIAHINVTAPGSDYLEPPQIAIVGGGDGQGALAIPTASTSTGQLISVSVPTGGTGYNDPPSVTIVGGGGKGATATAAVTAGAVSSVGIVNGGASYNNTIPPIIVFGAGNATAQAVIQGGLIAAINVINPGGNFTQNAEVLIAPVSNDPGSGAAATVVFEPTTLSGVIMQSYGEGYTSAPAVEIAPGANNAAAGTVTLMPFGVSGSSMETFASRLWIADPKQAAYATLPAGGNWQVSAAGGFTDFATSDGGVLFTNSDAFLQTRYTQIRQSNGYLYFFGDGSASVVSSVNTTGNPATTTFNYQNIDPQTGDSWRDSMQDFGRSIIFANETGIFGLYAGGATKISAKIDQIFDGALYPGPPNALFPSAGGITPSAAIAHLFNTKHYLLLITVTDVNGANPRNVMLTWNEKDWVITSQAVDLTYISEQKVESKFTAWGTDGSSLYPLFQTASPTLKKTLTTKVYGVDTLLVTKQLRGLWTALQDNTAAQSGVSVDFTFTGSGLALQASDEDFVELPNSTFTTGALVNQNPTLPARQPYWSVWGSGSQGFYFQSAQLTLTSESPDFTVGDVVIGYTDSNAIGI